MSEHICLEILDLYIAVLASQHSNQRNYKKEDNSTYENIKILNNYSKGSAL